MWLWYLLTGLAVVVLGPLASDTLQQVLYSVLGLSVIGTVLLGIRLHKPARRLAWYLLIGAMSATILANAGWAVLFATGTDDGSFSAVDFVYYAMYPLLALSLAILPVHGRYGSPLAGMTEAGVVTCTAAVLSWTLLVSPLVYHVGTLPADYDIVAYPVLDLLILGTAVRMALITGTRARSHLLIGITCVILLTADTSYFLWVAQGGDAAGSPITIMGWLLANVTIGASALHPSMADVATARSARNRHDRPVSLPIFVLLVLLSPAITAVSLISETRNGRVGILDIAVPIGATMISAVLLVVRLGQITGVAQRRAADLDARTVELEGALTQQAVLQSELTYQALHDPLTGLPNRAMLHDRIGQALAQDRPGALLIFDLDGFKDVNDRYGHPAGDALLRRIAQRMSDLVTGAGTVGRLGGDEFAVIFEATDAAMAATYGQRIVAAVRQPVDVGGHQLYVSASVGMRILEPGAATSDMVRDADLALYAAKAGGKDQLVWFDQPLRAERLDHGRMVEDLRSALRDGGLAVHYQPVVRLSDAGPVGVEALARWPGADGHMVAPDRFVPIAEDSGLIVALGEWVLLQACTDAAPWHRRFGTMLSVNVSPRQLREPDFAEMVLRSLTRSGLPATALALEITENVLVGAGRNTQRAISQLTELRLAGVRVALDDFGTGYSSLAYLRDLPIDTVKIDKSFMPVDGADTQQRIALVRAIIELAAGLGLRTVAEGVEHAAQAELLRDLGCDRAQGYHFAIPSTAVDVELLLAGGALP